MKFDLCILRIYEMEAYEQKNLLNFLFVIITAKKGRFYHVATRNLRVIIE